ncbi:MAG: hypothetical protein JWO27_3004 [Frankiales bacterium]|nr:hypothetical protein [Frankiales bacterium]
MFRDSRGVVHTVTAPDPLDDLPTPAADALARTLLVPSEGDLGTLLERCEVVVDLLERWQDAFFAALPPEVDIEEEARWAEQAGISLADIEDEWEGDGSDDDDESPGQLPLDAIGVDELIVFRDDDLGAGQLHPDTVAELESALMLLPMRVRLEALVAATTLVHTWCDLMADHEKCLGHLVLVHGERPEAHPHEVLVDRHAILHAGRAQHGT